MGDSGDESTLEKINHFGRGLDEINQRFNNRLSGKVLSFSKDYIDGRFGIVLYLHRRGQTDSERVALCLDSHIRCLRKCSAISTLNNNPALKADRVGRGDEHPVFVDILDLPEVPYEGRSIQSFVRLYVIEDKDLSLWEGHMYRPVVTFGGLGNRKINAYLQLLPRFMSWKGYPAVLKGRIDCPCQSGPKKIDGTVECVNSVAKVKRQANWDALFGSNADEAGMKISLYDDGIRVVCYARVHELFDAVDVVFGPFNLEP